MFCCFLALFEFLTYIGTDAVMPGMLAVVQDLQAGKDYIPWSFNIYLLGGVLFQWIIGPLSDRYGRRPLLLTGCAIFAVSCLAACFAHEISFFIVLRFVQGMGLGFVIVVSYPCMQELFDESNAVRLFALIANIALLSPLLGPLIGSFMLSFMPWQMLFACIAMLAMICWLGLWKTMPETVGVRKTDGSIVEPAKLNFPALFSSYVALLKNGRFITGCVALGLLAIPMLSWIAMSPVLLVKNLGLSQMAYAWWQVPVFGAVITGNFVLNFVAKSHDIRRILTIAVLPILVGLLLTMLLTQIHPTVTIVVIGLAVYGFGFGLGNAILYRLTLFSSTQSMGAASAVMGMISVGIVSLGGQFVSTLDISQRLNGYAAAASVPALVAVLLIILMLKQHSTDLSDTEEQP